MATHLLVCGSRPAEQSPSRRSALSLLELCVVLFIISVMLGLLLPAVQSARHRMQATVCENNIRQLSEGLRGYVGTTHRFPVPNRWTVDMLKWTEEWPLADAMNGNFDPNADFLRPPLLRCPMQEDYSSRVPGVGFSHYILAVDRPIRGRQDRVRSQIHDCELLSNDEQQEPWYLAPEISFAGQKELFATKPGPHPPGLYMTPAGPMPR